MARDYRVVVHFDALAALPQSGKRRAAVIGHLQILGQIAHLGGDYEVRDSDTGRPFNETRDVGYAITWWIDVPV
jgi:hypothetical protein